MKRIKVIPAKDKIVRNPFKNFVIIPPDGIETNDDHHWRITSKSGGITIKPITNKPKEPKK
jgi:hypothetical protein